MLLRVRRLAILWAVAISGALLAMGSPVWAGDGSLVEDPPGSGTYRIDATIFYDLPRTQEEFEGLIEQFRAANRWICDGSQGLIRFGDMSFESHPARKESADVWWFDRPDRATARGSFGMSAPESCNPSMDRDAPKPLEIGGRINVYSIPRAGTVVHELGHLLFGLDELYSDPRGEDRGHVFSTGIDGTEVLRDVARNLEFFRAPRLAGARVGEERGQLVFRERPLVDTFGPLQADGTPLYQNGAAGEPWWRLVTSPMQRSVHTCVTELGPAGRSPREQEPLLWRDAFCLSDADDNGDGIADECGPRCAGGADVGEACTTNADCMGGLCQTATALARLACTNPGPNLGNQCQAAGPDPSCDDAPGSGVCAVVGFPRCSAADPVTHTEYTTVDSFDRNRFNETLGDPVADLAPADPGVAQPARHLVLGGYLYPSSDDDQTTGMGGQPEVNSQGDFTCYNRGTDFAFSPAGNCLDADGDGAGDFCNPDLVEGEPAWQFACDNARRSDAATQRRCPGQLLPLSPDNGMAVQVQCDGCVLANTSACGAMLPLGSNPAALECGNGVVDREPVTGNFEQCDTGTDPALGTIDPTVPVDMPGMPGVPMRCRDAINPVTGIVPDPPMFGGTVRCQTNCFFDLSECALPFLNPDIVDPDGDGRIRLREVRDQSTAWTFTEAFDGAGRVGDPWIPLNRRGDEDPPDNALDVLDLQGAGPSNHGVYAFFRRVLRYRTPVPGPDIAWPTFNSYADHQYREVWQLLIGMSEAEFQDNAAGREDFRDVFREVRYLELEFDVDYVNHTSTLRTVNGVNWMPSDDDLQWPAAHFGYGAQQPGPFTTGECQFRDDCDSPQPETGAIIREDCTAPDICQNVTAPPFTLRLDLRNLVVATVEDRNDHFGADTFEPIREARSGAYHAFAGPVTMYARHDSVEHPPGSGSFIDVPQYGRLRYRLPREMPQCAVDRNDACCYPCDTAGPRPEECRVFDADEDGDADLDPCQVDDLRAELLHRASYNVETQRYESTDQTIDLLRRRFFGAAHRRGYGRADRQLHDLFSDVEGPNASIDSEWDVVDNVMCHQYGIDIPDLDRPQDTQDVDPDPDPVCDAPWNGLALPDPGEIVEYNGDTQIVFVMDKSDSMRLGSGEAFGAGAGVSRLDYVKIAAEAFLTDVLQTARNELAEHGPRIGLVYYDTEPSSQFLIPEVDESSSPGSCTLGSDCLESNTCLTPGTNDFCDAPEDCNNGETCVDNSCSAGGQCATSALKFLDDDDEEPIDTDTEIDIDVFRGFMLTEELHGTQVPDPSGRTGTGGALALARRMFDPRERNGVTPTKIVVHMSDGIRNETFGGDCLGPLFCDAVGTGVDAAPFPWDCATPNAERCPGGPCQSDEQAPDEQCEAAGVEAPCFYEGISGCWPSSRAEKTYLKALERFEAEGILAYHIPLANEGDTEAEAQLADVTGGKVFPATRSYGEDTIPAFMQSFAATRGQQLARSHLTPPVQVFAQGSEGGTTVGVYVIRVETGSQHLVVRASEYDARVERFDADSVVLVRPSGEQLSFSGGNQDPDVRVETAGLASTLYVQSPEPGDWAVMGDFGLERQGHYVAAHVENPTPVCYANVSSGVVDDSTPAIVTAQAFYERPIEDGVVYTVDLIRPDKVLTAMTMAPDPGTGLHQVTIPPEELSAKGVYQVNVRCEVAENASVDRGEPFEPGPSEPVQPEAFRRETSLSFLRVGNGDAAIPSIDEQDQLDLDATAERDCEAASQLVELTFTASAASCAVPATYASPAIPYEGDADGDGIPNADEPASNVDTDGDGVPDVLDPDSNGNGVPDGEDPDIDYGASCGDVSSLDPGPWPMRGYCPTHRGRGPFLGPDDGEVVWSLQTGWHVKSSPAVASDGSVYFGSDDDHVYAVHADGSLKWSYNTWADVQSSPAIGQNRLVYIGSDNNRVYAFDAQTGSVAWSFDTGHDVDSSPSIGPDGTIYVGSDSNKLYALDGDSGDVLWTYTTFGDIDSSPAISPTGTIYVGSDDNFVYALEPDPGLSAADRLRWKTYLGLDVEASPTVGRGPTFFVYVGSEADRVFKLDPASGDIVAEFQGVPDGDVDSSVAIGPDDTVYVGGDNNRLLALTPDLDLKWDFDTNGDINSTPAVGADGTIYVGSDDNFLYALKPDEGLSDSDRLLFKVYLGGDVRSSPAIGANGALYVGSHGKKLFAIANTGSGPGSPPEGACVSESFNDHTYWFCDKQRSWQDAHSHCEGSGISLVTIDDAAENAFLEAHLPGNAWIGGNDMAAEGDWIWVATGASFWSGDESGAPAGDAYTNWELGQPNDAFGDDCAEIKDSTGKWRDDDCHRRHVYVCEDPSTSLGVRSFATRLTRSVGCSIGASRETPGALYALAFGLFGLVLLRLKRRRRQGR